MPRQLVALAIGAFSIGSTEFIIMGLLPQIAAELHVSIAAIGVLITGYAIGVLIGAPTLTALSVKLTTRQTLMTVMGVFVVGNALTAVAPNYQVMMAARVISALAHGSFFGVGAIAARRAVAPEKANQAISLMFVGLTIANVAGVPIGTWVGQHTSWRYVFAGIAGLGIITMIAVRLCLPADQIRINMRAELGAFRRRQVWLLLGLTTIGFGALFAVYSYVSPILTEISGIGPGAVTLVLALFGLGTTVGTLAGGRVGDRFGLWAVAAGLLLVAGLLSLFTLTSKQPVLAVTTLVLFGAVAFGMGPVVQNKVIEAAGTSGSLVSAANQGAFNLANAIGAGLGALVIKQGLGLVAPMWVGAGLALAGVVLVMLSIAGERADASKSAVAEFTGAVALIGAARV